LYTDKVLDENVFSFFFVAKGHNFNPNPGGNSRYKYCPPHLEILVQNWSSSRARQF